MRKTLAKLRDKFAGSRDYDDEFNNDYLEIDTEKDVGKRAKVLVKPYIIEDFGDIKDILDALRAGYTIALINIRPLKDRDIVELKRAVNKLKKTCDAIEGDIAGFGDDWIVVTPSFAQIHRTKQVEELDE